MIYYKNIKQTTNLDRNLEEDPICGPGTILSLEDGERKCIFNSTTSQELEKIFESTKLQILPQPELTPVEPKNKIFFIGNNKWEKTNWINDWIQKGRTVPITKNISGENIVGIGVNCSCGDCAAWRGGNAGSCVGNDIAIRPGNYTRRVACDTNEDPDRCICISPYTPLGGLCVTPWIPNPNNGLPCCSQCVYDGTCIGEESCDPSWECKENIVKYPGPRYECSQEPNTVQEFEDFCVANPGSDGKNEYQCAWECQKDTQVECSKDCLPWLWKWDPIIIDNKTYGWIQTDKIMQFENEDVVTRWCDPENPDCNINTIKNNVTNCRNCEECTWVLNEVINKWEYTCNKCKTCDNNCSKGRNCSICRVVDNPLTPSPPYQVYCDICEEAEQCLEKDLENPLNFIDVYNKGQGYNPDDIVLWDDGYLFTSSVLSTLCRQNGQTNTCSTNSNGFDDGGGITFFGGFENGNCIKRGSCNVFPPFGLSTDVNNCFGGLTHEQMGPQCNVVPLDDIGEIEYTNEINRGVAQGVSKSDCEKYFCRLWIRGDRWADIGELQCDALCSPEKFKNDLPALVTSKQQIDILLASN